MKAESFFEFVLPLLEKNRLDLILITKIINIQYLTGFTGSSGFIIVDRERTYFLTDPRYTEQAKSECKDWIVEEIRGIKLSQWIADRYKPKRVGVDEWLQVGSLERIKQVLGKAEFIVLFDLVESLRIKKQPIELELIKKALNIAESAFNKILKEIRPGVMERDIALELDYQMRKMGASSSSFDIIVASGYRSSLPHGVASNKRIEEKDIVLIDFGCIYNGYCSDVTRVVKLGRVEKEEKYVWEVIVDAMNRAIENIKDGIKASEIHGIAENAIDSKGYGRFFGHGLGHGVGREVHEKPSVSPLSEDRIIKGSVFTIEPGIYLPNRFGIRVEDMVFLGEEPEVLTSLPREILQI